MTPSCRPSPSGDLGLRRIDILRGAWRAVGKLAIKVEYEEISAEGPSETFIAEAIAQASLSSRSCRSRYDHVAALVDLPFHHKDPFDRLIVAQAKEEGIDVSEHRLPSWTHTRLPASGRESREAADHGINYTLIRTLVHRRAKGKSVSRFPLPFPDPYPVGTILDSVDSNSRRRGGEGHAGIGRTDRDRRIPLAPVPAGAGAGDSRRAAGDRDRWFSR